MLKTDKQVSHIDTEHCMGDWGTILSYGKNRICDG